MGNTCHGEGAPRAQCGVEWGCRSRECQDISTFSQEMHVFVQATGAFSWVNSMRRTDDISPDDDYYHDGDDDELSAIANESCSNNPLSRLPECSSSKSRLERSFSKADLDEFQSDSALKVPSFNKAQTLEVVKEEASTISSDESVSSYDSPSTTEHRLEYLRQSIEELAREQRQIIRDMDKIVCYL